MAVFERGEPIANGCLDIGGRLLRFEDDDCTVHSFSPAMPGASRGTRVCRWRRGTRLTGEETDRLAQRMAEVLEEAAGLRPRTPLHDDLCVEACLPDIALRTFIPFPAACRSASMERTRIPGAFMIWAQRWGVRWPPRGFSCPAG